jgi:hypothetical protein
MDYPTTGKEAREKGIKKYFTGKECKFGHVAPRHAHNGQCTACGKIATQKSRETEHGKLWEKEYYKKIRITRFEYIMWRSARGRSLKRNVPFTITPEQIKECWPINNECPILGLELKHNFDAGGGNNANSPSLDCIIPSLGYTPNNIIIISQRANLIKNNETDPEIFKKIASWLELYKKE